MRCAASVTARGSRGTRGALRGLAHWGGMQVCVSTSLDCPAEQVVDALREVDTLRRVSRGLLAFDGADGDLPRYWPLDGRPVALHIRPLHGPIGWRHTIRLVEYDPDQGVLRSEESGGPVQRWAHRIEVRPVTSDRCTYTDDVEVEAGLLTPVMAGVAAVFYRWRQHRWRALARTLAAEDEPERTPVRRL